MARKKAVPQNFVYATDSDPTYLETSDVSSSIEEAAQAASENGDLYDDQPVTVFRLVPVATVAVPPEARFVITPL